MGDQKRLFLSAGWHNLLLFNYAVDPGILTPYLPAGAELDLLDGSAHLSLVAFQFLNTRVFGIPWPGFVNFPEINLRFYVRYKSERGVCFVREYVPSWLVAKIAQVTYNEPYKSAIMTHAVNRSQREVTAAYTLRDGSGSMRLYAKGTNQPFMPDAASREHHFKEHELGVGRDRQGNTVTYRVHHPHWDIYPVIDSDLQVDAAQLYGDAFAFLTHRKPDSVVFAVGSEIKVFAKDH